MRFAPAFHEVIVPSRSLLIMASSDDSTMDASRADTVMNLVPLGLIHQHVDRARSAPLCVEQRGRIGNEAHACAVGSLCDALHSPDRAGLP